MNKKIIKFDTGTEIEEYKFNQNKRYFDKRYRY